MPIGTGTLKPMEFSFVLAVCITNKQVIYKASYKKLTKKKI